MNKKKLIKSLLIGGAVYAGMEFSYFLGEGHAIGILAKYEEDNKPSEIIQMCAKEKRLTNKLVSKIAQSYES